MIGKERDRSVRAGCVNVVSVWVLLTYKEGFVVVLVTNC